MHGVLGGSGLTGEATLGPVLWSCGVKMCVCVCVLWTIVCNPRGIAARISGRGFAQNRPFGPYRDDDVAARASCRCCATPAQTCTSEPQA